MRELHDEGHEERMGVYHILWGRQKQILKPEYRDNWRSPAEMSPEILFD